TTSAGMYVRVNGVTVGPLAAAVDISGKADKTYVDTQDALKVAKAGDTMTGPLAIPWGSTSAPGLAMAGAPTTGIYGTAASLTIATSGVWGVSVGGTAGPCGSNLKTEN